MAAAAGCGADRELLHVQKLETVRAHPIHVALRYLRRDSLQNPRGVFESHRRPYRVGVLQPEDITLEEGIVICRGGFLWVVNRPYFTLALLPLLSHTHEGRESTLGYNLNPTG